MPALINAVRNQSFIVGQVPSAGTGTVTSAAIDLSQYEGQIALTEYTGAVAASGTITTTLTWSATSGGSYAAITGVPTFTAAKTTGNFAPGLAETIFVDLNAVPAFLKVVTTLVSGTSVASAVAITAVKKVQ